MKQIRKRLGELESRLKGGNSNDCQIVIYKLGAEPVIPEEITRVYLIPDNGRNAA